MERADITQTQAHSRNEVSPSLYTYADNALQGYFKLSNVKDKEMTVDFGKLKGRDN